MASSDRSTLMEMGFTNEEEIDLALKQGGNLDRALDLLTRGEVKKPAATAGSAEEEDALAEPPALNEGEVARSLVCNDCGKRFRSQGQAEFHANKTEHQNFSESTEEIKPLTEEEKKQKLADMRAALAEKKAKQVFIDKEDAKRNEKIRMKSTQDVQTIMEDLEKKEQIKAAAAKRKEKQDDILAKQRIKDKIAADKEERRLKAERAKAEREGRAPPPDPSLAAAAAAPVASKPANVHTEARLRLQTSSGNVMKTFPAETTLFEVAEAVKAENGGPVASFSLTYPKKVFEGSVDFGKTLKEAGLVPSAVLIVK